VTGDWVSSFTAKPQALAYRAIEQKLAARTSTPHPAPPAE
jgi:hypothetical protein